MIASLSFAHFAQAQQAKVIKVKGQQAIVQFPQGVLPTVGQTFDLSGGASGGGTLEGAPVRSGTRDHLIGLSTNLSFLSSSAGGSTSTFNFIGKYGWNMQTIEFGPIATISYVSQTNQTDRTLGAGGFFDFNFVPNVSGQSFIYGVGAEATYSQFVRTLPPGDTSTPILDLIVGGNAKWFGLSDHFALRGDAGLNMQRSSPATGTTTLTGLIIRGGIAVYF